MNLDHRRTDPRVPAAVRSAAWFCWNDDAPAPEHVARACDREHDDAAAQQPPPREPGASLTEERLHALRRWIANGGHNSPDIAEQVARRILERGDV
jgi:hypothetical protein